jgi:UDP-glucose 4-epimerase
MGTLGYKELGCPERGNDMKVGITGGQGFIGSYVVREALNRGYTPVVMDRHNKGNLPEGVEFFLGDVMDNVAMTEFAAHVDGIIHLAAVLGTQETIANPRPAALSNVTGGLNFLEAVAQYDIPGVYICVGNRGMYATYSLTKSLVEDFCIMYNKYRGTRVNQVRAMNAYGPRQLSAPPFAAGKVRKITPAFVCRALCNMDIEIYGDGTQVSDMVYVGDVACALVNALEEANKGNVFDRVVEVGPKDNKTVNEVAQLIMDMSNSTSKIVHLPMRPGETPNATVKADYSTLELVGMKEEALTPLEQGMKETVEWFEQNKGVTWHDPEHA